MTKDFDERNAEKSRKVCAAMAEVADTGRRKLSERERHILDMWPRFEDGEYVWFGDEVEMQDEIVREVWTFTFDVNAEGRKRLYLNGFEGLFMLPGEPVKRPAPIVLDADGVEIKVGDTVWFKGKPTEYKVDVVLDGTVYLTYKNHNGDNATATTLTRNLTHTRPDSWERLDEDVNTIVTGSGMYRRLNDYCNKRDLGGDDVTVLTVCDIVRRAKKLAGVEAGQ